MRYAANDNGILNFAGPSGISAELDPDTQSLVVFLPRVKYGSGRPYWRVIADRHQIVLTAPQQQWLIDLPSMAAKDYASLMS